MRGKRSGNKRRKELFLSVFRGRKRKEGAWFFNKKKRIFRKRSRNFARKKGSLESKTEVL